MYKCMHACMWMKNECRHKQCTLYSVWSFDWSCVFICIAMEYGVVYIVVEYVLLLTDIL